MIFFFLLISNIYAVNAQKSLAEFTAQYRLSYYSDNEKKLSSTFTIHVKGAWSRTDVASKSGTEVTIYDSKNGIGRIYKDYSGQKLLIQFNQQEWISMQSGMNVSSFEEKGSDIPYNGYVCNKVIGKNGKKQLVEMVYIPSLIPENKSYQMAFPEVKGLPAEIKLSTIKDNKQLTVVYELLELSTDLVNTNVFEPSTNGYRVLSYTEMNKDKN